MTLIRSVLVKLVMVYSCVSSQVTATENANDDKQVAHQTTNEMASISSEDTSLTKSAIQFYARNYRAINFWTIVVPIAATSIYGMNYVYDSYQQAVEQRNQRIAMYNQQQEEYRKTCMLASNQCNGTWIPISPDTCSQSLLENMCYRVLFDCTSKLCGWSLLFCQDAAHTAAQLIVNGNACP